MKPSPLVRSLHVCWDHDKGSLWIDAYPKDEVLSAVDWLKQQIMKERGDNKYDSAFEYCLNCIDVAFVDVLVK